MGEWDPTSGGQGIQTWFFPSGSEPADLLSHRPQPNTWGASFAHFTLDPSVCPATHFKNMRLVFDLTFCGDLGNPTFAQSCPSAASQMKCEDWIASQRLPEAYWFIRTLDVYEWNGVGTAPAGNPRSSYSYVPVAVLCVVVAFMATVFLGKF